MSNPYLSYIEEDPVLHSAVAGCLPNIRRLTPLQIEKLVFYLKNLQGYYEKSENHIAFSMEFAVKLDALRSGVAQQALQRQTSICILKGIASCVLAGGLLSFGIVAALGNNLAITVGVTLAAVGIIIYADAALFKKAVVIGKEQDRKYFLASIREARACNELDWAGLFSYNDATKHGSHSDEDLERLAIEVGKLTSSLRTALYNDEYFQYSDPKLREHITSHA